MINSIADTFSAEERQLLVLLLRGRTPAEAVEALGLPPNQGYAVLDALLAQQGITGRRQLLVRALIHHWVRV